MLSESVRAQFLLEIWPKQDAVFCFQQGAVCGGRRGGGGELAGISLGSTDATRQDATPVRRRPPACS